MKSKNITSKDFLQFYEQQKHHPKTVGVEKLSHRYKKLPFVVFHTFLYIHWSFLSVLFLSRSTILSFICLSFYLPILVSTCLCISLSLHQSIFACAYPCLYLFIYVSVLVSQSVCLSICKSVPIFVLFYPSLYVHINHSFTTCFLFSSFS